MCFDWPLSRLMLMIFDSRSQGNSRVRKEEQIIINLWSICHQNTKLSTKEEVIIEAANMGNWRSINVATWQQATSTPGTKFLLLNTNIYQVPICLDFGFAKKKEQTSVYWWGSKPRRRGGTPKGVWDPSCLCISCNCFHPGSRRRLL